MARKFDIHFDDGSVQRLVERTSPPPPPAVQLYMHKEDREVFGSIRSCAPCPAVMVLKDDPHAIMTQQWQYFIRAINYNMTLENAYLLLDSALAFANRTGFRHGRIRADYFHNKDLSAKPPQLDKVRTCSRNVLTGVEQYSLMQTLREVTAIAGNIGKRRVRSFLAARNAFVESVTASVNVLKVKLFDSRQNPPLKPGRSYPNDISKVNPDDYLYMPQTHPELFIVANIVNAKGEVVQFPRGALYPWFLGGKTPASFMPHVANFGYGDVLHPLWKLQKVDSVPSPYRYID